MKTKQTISIDRDKCIGCGQCVSACHMSALEMVDGRAMLVRENQCDGLGVCIGECPVDAITFEEVPVEEPKRSDNPASLCGCPSSRNMMLPQVASVGSARPAPSEGAKSQLGAWPIQLHLVRPEAPQFQGADVLIAASCSAFTCGDFHESLLKGRGLIIACPKLDRQDGYREKLVDLFRHANPRSVTVARMEVPCCKGLIGLVLDARAKAESNVAVEEVVVGIQGEILETCIQ